MFIFKRDMYFLRSDEHEIVDRDKQLCFYFFPGLYK
jgi:hypothetical protein